MAGKVEYVTVFQEEDYRNLRGSITEAIAVLERALEEGWQEIDFNKYGYELSKTKEKLTDGG